MVGCFVPRCPSGHGVIAVEQTKTEDGRKPILFSPPKDINLRKIWENKIKRGDKELDNNSKVCELHFTEADFLIRNAPTNLENGKIRKRMQKTTIKKLKPTAIPSIFKEYPKYLQKQNLPSQRKLPYDRATFCDGRPTQARKRRAYRLPPADDQLDKENPSEDVDEGPTQAQKKKVKRSPLEESSTNQQSNKTLTSSSKKSSDKDVNGDCQHITDPCSCKNNVISSCTSNDNMQLEIIDKEKERQHNLNLEELDEIVVSLTEKDAGGENFDSLLLNARIFKTLYDDVDSISQPNNWCKGKDIENQCIVFTRWKSEENCVDYAVTYDKSMVPKITYKSKTVSSEIFSPGVIQSKDALEKFLYSLDNQKVCEGYEGKHSDNCHILITTKSKICLNCIKKLRSVRVVRSRRKRYDEYLNNTRQMRRRSTMQRLSQAVWKAKKTISQLRQTLRDCQSRCAQIPETQLEEKIQELDEGMQETVRACFQSAKAKGPNGRRYTQEWIYQCLLIRIRGPGLYNMLRDNKRLPLPTFETLRKYTRNLKASYGFQDSTFQMMKNKRHEIDSRDAHGNLLIDEVMLSQTAKFNAETLEVQGYVDLGQYTPNDQTNVLGDHGLVFMYQSYHGGWVQVIGNFLTKGAANGDILHNLILEAVLLLEGAGYHVDGVVTDGASWNYNMWKQFGVGIGSGPEMTNCCEHPCDEKRKLFFFSDFPHLVKNMRNNFLDRRTFKVPEGFVRKKYWDLLVTEEEDKKLAKKELKKLKRNPKFNKTKCNPKNTERMKVSWAFQFYSLSNSACITLNREQNVKGFEDSKVSSDFCKKMDELCDAMNNRDYFNALKRNSKSEKIIKDFLVYLKEWDDVSAEKTLKIRRKTPKGQWKETCKRAFLTDPTAKGLYVTLKSTLGLMEYLTDHCGFDYLLTRRLNQDALEHFFGLVRGIGGASTHPNSVQFAQLVKLLSLYSLIKPPRGSNVYHTGAERLQSFLKCTDLSKFSVQERRKKLEDILDCILDDGESLSEIPHLINDHDYCFSNTGEVDQFVVSYLAGYIARKAFKWCNDCIGCKLTLTSVEAGEFSRLIDLKSKGHLLYPSSSLEAIVTSMETSVQRVIGQKDMCRNYVFDLVEGVKLDASLRVGCESVGHQKLLTKKVLNFFIMTRMHFLCRVECGANRNFKLHNKLAKL